MKFILFLTIGICCFPTFEAADPIYVGYQLALGPLEFFLSLQEKEVAHCYEEKKDAYEKSIDEFYKRLHEIIGMINRHFTVNSKRKGWMAGGYNAMSDIFWSLKKYYELLKHKIWSRDLIELGKAVWDERRKIEELYKKYEDNGASLKYHSDADYGDTFWHINFELEKIFKKSEEINKYILECLESKGVTYTKKNS